MDGFMKVLKNDGQFIVSTPVREVSRPNPLNSYHYLEYTSSALRRLLNHYFIQVDIYLQNQDKFYRIDDEINWGFVIAVCKYPRNRMIDDLSLIFDDSGDVGMSAEREDSYISESAVIAKNVIFKPTFDDGIYYIADKAEVRDNTIIEAHNNGKLTLGKNSAIGYNCWLNATGGIHIGDNTLIGANTIITSSSHHFKSKGPIVDQGMSFEKVTIGSNVWIGSNVSILEGVTIGDDCVIGANSVIKEDVPANSIVKSSNAVITERITRDTVAFYMLPFEIRNNGLTFQCIHDRYKKLALSFQDLEWDIVFIATNELSKIIRADGWHCVSPVDFNFEYDSSKWMERWKGVLNDQEDKKHLTFIEKAFGNNIPKLTFCWNYDGVLKKFCKENKISIFLMC
ncbi:MAG: Putative acetyltransferase [Candidatus Erwinia impunctatus]|nr:Putative acetyltransferase [Culicoides impunctatus]